MRGQPTCYILNSNAIGDTCASLAILKYLIETFHKDGKYKVLIVPQFRELLHFVPSDKLFSVFDTINFEEPYITVKLNILEQDRVKTIKLPDTNMVYDGTHYTLNMPKGFKGRSIKFPIREVKITAVPQYVHPLRMHLSHYASIQFSNRIPALETLNYPQFPLDKRITETFNIDFTKCVAINTIFRGATRQFNPDELLKICNYIKDCGYVPLFVGKTETPEYCQNEPYNNIEFNTSVGIDLVNKTTLSELVNILAECKVVMGIDNGLIHLAALTNVPIIAGYTIASPELRLPIRSNILGYDVQTVVPDVECRFCQDTTQLDNTNFNKCINNTNQCLKELNSEKFIHRLKNVLI